MPDKSELKVNADQETGMIGRELICPHCKTNITFREFKVIQQFSDGLQGIVFQCTNCEERFNYEQLKLGMKVE